MKLSSIFITLALLTIYSTNILSTERICPPPPSAGSTNVLREEDFYTKYKQPKTAQGNPADFLEFLKTGNCYGCNLQDFDLRESVDIHQNEKN